MPMTHPQADDPTVVDFLENVSTPETPEDLNPDEVLGNVYAFGYTLTPDQVEAVAEGLRYQARIARCAVMPGVGTGPTQAEWEQGWIHAVATHHRLDRSHDVTAPSTTKADVPDRTLGMDEEWVPVAELREGDMVDLEADPVADPDGDDMELEFEYLLVDAVTNGEREGAPITAVEFINGAYVVFPAGHKVIAVRADRTPVVDRSHRRV